MKSGSAIVYIVDDDLSICRALSILLKSHGFNVKMFTSAEDFLTSKHFKAPSCLILDIQLPGIDGLALQAEMVLRKLEIPIVFITGHGDIPMSVKGMRGGGG
jgi:FixJ family two-component response regulator